MQGNHATELMSRARSRRNLYQPEPGTGPSVCSVGHYVVSVRISVWHRRVPVPFVSRRGQSNDTSNLNSAIAKRAEEQSTVCLDKITN